jgi:hypothetical protein
MVGTTLTPFGLRAGSSAHPTKDSAIFRIARVTWIAALFANPPYKGKEHLLM